MELYYKTSLKISKLITKQYSTSFSLACKFFSTDIQKAIYSIYGFVRFADEIVDSFHDYDKKYLLDKFEADFYEAFKMGISLNPVLQSFQLVVKQYNIPIKHVDAFILSMKADLAKNNYLNKEETDQYIYGSADVVGLMCLRVFCNGNESMYNELELPSMKLGAAFQKVNFLRDIKNDTEVLERNYFSELLNGGLNNKNKEILVRDIESDFNEALVGIRKLPNSSRLAVTIAYLYYKALLLKIKQAPASRILETRIRISNFHKSLLIVRSITLYKLGWI